MKLNNNKTIMAAALLALSACSSNSNKTDPTLLDGGATQATFGMKLSALATNAAKASPRAVTSTEVALGATGISISSAQLNVDEIKIKLPDGISCADAALPDQAGVTCETEEEVEDTGTVIETKVKIQGPFVFDLMTGTSVPSLADFTLPSGLYRKVELKIKDALSGDMAGLALLATGSFVDQSAVSHGFRLALSFDEEIKIENSSDVEVREQISNSLVSFLNSDLWFGAVDIAQCVADGDLTIDSGTDTLIIDEATHSSGACNNIESDVKDNIKNSFEFENEDDSSHDVGDDNSTI